jgi:hypothetical protein
MAPEELEELDPANDDDVTIELHKAYRTGRKEALLQAIEHSVLNHKPIPRWARHAFDEAYTYVTRGGARSWDAVFGKPHLGKHLRTSQQENRKYEIYQRVKRLHDRKWRGKQIPLDEYLFAHVGKRSGIGSATVVKDLYYQVEHALRILYGPL